MIHKRSKLHFVQTEQERWWWWWSTAFILRHISVKNIHRRRLIQLSQLLHICWNKWVLRDDLKRSMLSISRSEEGREFHSRGAIDEKARSPYPLRWVMGTWRVIPVPDERKPGRRRRCSMREVTYPGAKPWTALKVRRRILNSILYLIGSQCSSVRIGVMWSYFFVPVSRRAAAFCTPWSLFSIAEGRPTSRLLQKSILEVTKEWIRLSAAERVRSDLIAEMFRSW